MEILEIRHKKNNYKIEKEKLAFLICKLSNLKINKNIANEELKKLAEKFKLINETTLSNVNLIW